MIICAAIRFYIVKTDREVIICGLRHGDCYSQLAALGFSPKEDYKELKQGFVNDKGEFLDRYEALDHAFEIGQISMTTWQVKHDKRERELYSEDLW